MKYNFEEFFSSEEGYIKEIFADKIFVWEIISELTEIISQQFKNQNFHPNYKNNIYIGKGTIIEEGVYIKGPAIIGDNCEIRHGSYLRENCILGNNVLIGHATEIKNSLLLDNSVVNHFNYVGDSIIGCNAHLAAGAIIANLRFDKKKIFLKTNSGKIETGLEKFGAIVGDNSEIGANAVLNPGTILGKNTVVYPLTSVSGVHMDGEIIR